MKKRLIGSLMLFCGSLVAQAPYLLPNGWLAGTVIPSSCKTGQDPAFYNTSTSILYECLGNSYVTSVGPGTGTVTSVGLATPGYYAVSGSPVTTNGTLTVASATGLTSHQVIGTCGTATTIGLCGLVAADIPSLNYQAPISLTTTGSSGAATFIGNVLNVPQYTGGGGSSFYQTMQSNGTPQTQEPALNFIPGTNVTISCADGTSVTNCTFNSTASGMVYPSGSGFAVVSGGTSWGTTLADPLTGTHGGTGVNNGANTLTLAGNVAFSGAFNPTFVIPASGTWTFPAAGTLVNTGVTALNSMTSASSLATVGTIGTGVWHGTIVGSAYGGTGVNNTSTLTLGTSNVNLATLGTGIVKNTTTTGNLTNAASSDVIALWTTCTVGYLKYDGTCSNPAGTGTVTVVGAGSLTSTALVTGGGTQTVQTPSATTTLDSSGNFVTPGAITTGSGGSVAGYLQMGQGTAPSVGTTAITETAPASVTSYLLVWPGAAASGLPHWTNSSGTVTETVSTVATADIAANAVTSAKLAVVNTRRVCDIAVGDTSASAALVNGQLGPQKRICYIPAASTVVEMDVAADGGTPNVIVAVSHAGSDSNIVSSALATVGSGGIACSNTGGTTGIDGTTTCSATLQNTSMAAGDYLELVSGTAGGTAKFMTIHVIYTVN